MGGAAIASATDKPPQSVENGDTLPAGTVVQRVRRWVATSASQRPGFAGAYLWGGINALAADAPFALYRDVDVVVVSDADRAADAVEEEVLFQNLSLEVITLPVDAHRDADAVLADPSQAPNLAATQILADPRGILAPLQRKVAAQFAEPRWIRARCAAEKTMARDRLDALREARETGDRINAVWLWLNALSGLLAVARLKRPTTRRTLCLLGELLLEQGRRDVFERVLDVWGSACMQRSDVEAMLARSAAAFDRAVEVYTTPIAMGFVLRPHLRPYFVQGTQEMIEQGQHREAVYWIMAMGADAYLALLNDAPDAEKPAFATELRALHEALGYTSPEAWALKVQQVDRLTHDVFGVADRIVVAE